MSVSRARRSTATPPRVTPAGGPAGEPVLDAKLAEAEVLAATALRGEKSLQGTMLVGFESGMSAPQAAWAALGAMERGQLDVARDLVEGLLGRQRADGALPVKLARRLNVVDRMRSLLGKPVPYRAPERAVFADTLSTQAAATAMTAWAAAEYALRAGDDTFVTRWAEAMEQAVGYVEAHVGQGLPDVGCEAAYYQAQMALGHVAIARGDAVAGARRWAAAAEAKGRIQDAERAPDAGVGDELLAVYVGACDRPTAQAAVARATTPVTFGLAALAAVRAGDTPLASQLLSQAADAAIAAGRFSCAAAAGRYVRALDELGRAHAEQPPAARTEQRRELSADEARILSAC